MDKPKTDQVVLFIDHLNTGHPSMETHQNNINNDTTTTTNKPKLTSRVKTLNRLSFSKPKSRIQEHYHPLYTQFTVSEEAEDIAGRYSSTDDEWNEDDDEEEDQVEEDGPKSHEKTKRRRRKIQWKRVVEWALFLIILTSLVSCLTIPSIKTKYSWGLEIWKWCLMGMVTFSGRLVSGWLVAVSVFIIERNFMLREKVLYFIYGLRKSIRNCIWLGLVLFSYWTVVFDNVQKKNHKFLNKVFQALVAVLVGAIIWLVKIVLVKMLASSFHVATYFDRMKESVFHHYILDTLSGPPLEENDETTSQHTLTGSKSMPANWKGRNKAIKEAKNLHKSKKFGSRKIDMDKLRELSMKSTASAWSVKRLVNYVKSSGLSTISRTIDDFGNAESEICSEWEARNCAQRIFKNVAKPGAKYIEEEDLMRFLKRVEVHTIFPLFEGALETGKISRSSFRNWVIRAYYERKALAQSLNDTKTAVQQLHKIASSIVTVIIIVVLLLVMELATIKVILFVITQIVLVGVAFQGTCKTVLEAIIFVFVMHPFDIGDRCVIDDVHMTVEEMNILTTVFLRYDNEKIYYPNAVLLNKPISNFYRSPEMWDSIDFVVDVSTPMETIISLKKAIQTYIESKPKYWNPKHAVIAKEIENVDKLKLCLCVQHTINHQNYGERNNRITELLLELKKIFEVHGVKYNLLPQEVHITKMNSTGNGRPVL
ncbi:mechanosensitive ion channel protein 10-like [Prosopis cineraria]|uniref:mechanosensitive ion channel protein 10-like n=1 Tax=Prosopis cineraria TaxID=364024 RepID=UPI00240FD674|nr:mechanosensitive ion channel protein 10-like [Prosopis cineraria]